MDDACAAPGYCWIFPQSCPEHVACHRDVSCSDVCLRPCHPGFLNAGLAQRQCPDYPEDFPESQELFYGACAIIAGEKIQVCRLCQLGKSEALSQEIECPGLERRTVARGLRPASLWPAFFPVR